MGNQIGEVKLSERGAAQHSDKPAAVRLRRSLRQFFLDPIETALFDLVAQIGRAFFHHTTVDQHVHKSSMRW